MQPTPSPTTHQPSARQVFVLLNPHARTGRAGQLWPHLKKQLEKHTQIQLGFTQTIAEALQFVRQIPVGSRLVVVGGDGTLNQMLGAILERSLELGLVPYGSGNDTARAIGLHHLTWQQALWHALEAPATAYDIGWVEATDQANGTGLRALPFISSFSVGFDANVGYRAMVGPKGLGGLPRYVLAALKEWLSMRHWPLVVQCDGKDIHSGNTVMATSLNTPTYGGGQRLMPNATVNDGLLNLMLVKDLSRSATLVGLLALAMGHRLNRPQVSVLPYSCLSVTSEHLFPIGADGEFLGWTQHLSITVQPKALRIVQNV